MKLPLPRGDVAELIRRGKIPNALAELVKESFPLQEEQAKFARRRKQNRRPGPASMGPFIRAAYNELFPEGHKGRSLREVRRSLRSHIKQHFNVWNDIDDKTFQRHGL
jgi:hypothetical protein